MTTAAPNGTQWGDKPIGVAIVTFAMILPSVLTLLLILLFFRCEPRLRESSRYVFFLNLITVDVLLLISIGMESLFRLENANAIPITVCVIFSFTSLTFIVNGVGCICLMAVERYVAICHPLRYFSLFNKAAMFRCLAVIWIIPSFPLLIEAFFFFKNDLSSLDNVLSCDNKYLGYRFNAGYTFMYIRLTESLMLLIVCSAIIICSYVGVIRAAKNVSAQRSTNFAKARRTIQLHGLQLLLYLSIFVAIPVYEFVFWQPSEGVTNSIMDISMYLIMIVFPRVLGSFIYGVRDEQLRRFLKKALRSVCRKIQQNNTQ